MKAVSTWLPAARLNGRVWHPNGGGRVGDSEQSPIVWLRSTASGGGNCVEVSFTGMEVQLRDSREPDGPVLSFSRPQWKAFITGVHDGEFDIE